MRYLNSSLLRLEPGKLAGCSAPQSVEHLRALLDEGVGAGPFQMNLEKQQGFLFGLPFRLLNFQIVICLNIKVSHLVSLSPDVPPPTFPLKVPHVD